MRKYICILMAFMLLVSTFAYAQELTKREDYSEDYYAVYHYATTQDQEEDLPFREDYYYEQALQSSVLYQTLQDGTLRTDVLNDKGQLEGYSLYQVFNGKEMTEEYDANDKIIYRHEQVSDHLIITVYSYLENGSLDRQAVTTHFSSGMIRTDHLDADGKLLYYTLETIDRVDRYDPDGRLEEFTLYQIDEDGTYRESTFNSRGEMLSLSVQTYEEDGAIRIEEYSGQGHLQGYTLTRFDDIYAIVETYDADGTLLSTVKEDAMMH